MRKLTLLALLAPVVAFGQSNPVGINNSLPEDVNPPNNAPVWNNTPGESDSTPGDGVITFQYNTNSAYDLTSDASDADLDPLTFADGGTCTFPEGVTLSGNSIDSGNSTDTTPVTGCTLTVSDGIASPVTSSSFGITVLPESSGPNDDFPRIALVAINGFTNYGITAQQQAYAKADLVILNGWPNFNVNGHTIDQQAADLRTINPGITMGFYVNLNETFTDANSGAWNAVKTKLSSEDGAGGVLDWWARRIRDTGTHTGSNNASTLTDAAGGFVSSEYVGDETIVYNVTDGSEGVVTANSTTTITATLSGGTDNDWDNGDSYRVYTREGHWPGTRTKNISPTVTADSNGDILYQWYSGYVTSEFFAGGQFDIAFIDVMSSDPYVTADWDVDGDNDTTSDPAVVDFWTQAHADFADQLKADGGVTWVINNSTEYWQDPFPTNYVGHLNGALIEFAMGEVWSIEGTDASGSTNAWGSWTKMMTAYNARMSDSVEPKLVVMTMRAFTNDYDFMRYGLCSTLMNNGYFYLTDDTDIWKTMPWFDEYDYNLGQPVDPPQTSPYSNGVYVRQFDNGLAVVNPRTNGQQTITLPTPPSGFHWELLDASAYSNQDPAVNTGATVTQITINDADGRIIRKVSD